MTDRYWKAVFYIAERDNAGDLKRGELRELILMASYLYGVREDKVRENVLKCEGGEYDE